MTIGVLNRERVLEDAGTGVEPRRIALVGVVVTLLIGAIAPGRVAQAADRDAVRVELSNSRTLENAAYRVSFTTGPAGALDVGDTITLTAPIGTDFNDSDSGWVVEADGEPVVISNVTGQPHGGDFTLNQILLTIASPIAANTPVTIDAAWVTNPGPAKRQTLSVATSSEPDPAWSNDYDIEGTGQVEWSTYEDPTIPPKRCWGSATGTTNCPQRSYMVYEPPGPRGHQRPLLIDLHGCFTTAATEARWSRFHELAAERNFVLLFPQQNLAANGGRCWNWFDPDHQHRNAGEPALIAGIVRTVITRYRIDSQRVFISGISAGGAMSNIMMVTYPDLFASGVVYAGCEYGGLPCIGAAAAQPPHMAAEAAAAEMGPRLRSVPVFAVTGDLDEVVPFPNAEQVVQQWLATDAIRRSGVASPVPALPTESQNHSPSGRESYTVDVWRDGSGCLLAQRWTIHGMAHQWSGAQSNGSPLDLIVADPDGPNLSAAIVDFFFAHPMPRTATPCDW